MFATPKAKKELFLASSLCDGVEDNNIKQVTTLLDSNEADPNTLVPIFGITPFHLAIGNPSESFAEEVTKLFLRHGGNPNIRSIEGLTPVHIAAAWGRCKILELLLVNGGDPLYLDNEGYSPFHFAFDGAHYNAVTVLRKYCENVANDEEDEEEIKYDIALEKVLINNKNLVAEYVVTDEQTSSTLNISPENVLELNIKSSNGSSSSDYQLLLNEDYITRRKNRKILQEQKENKPSNETEVYKYKKEEQADSQLISNISTTISNDITRTDNPHNSDSSIFDRRKHLIPKTKNSLAQMSNQLTNKRNEITENLIRGRLKRKLKDETNISSPTLDKQRTRTPLIEKKVNNLENSIISKSPNCNILTQFKPDKTIQKSLFLEKTNYLNDSIITKSPNCAIVSSANKEKRISKIPIFGQKSTPPTGRNSLKKIISRTPCGLISETYKLHCQRMAQISKSLPRNFQNKILGEQESPFFKRPESMERKINSCHKKKDTEESSGIYSDTSKIMKLKNVAMKLEDYITEDFDSLTSTNNNSNVTEDTKIDDNFEENATNSMNNTDENNFNTSLENMTSNLSDSSSRINAKSRNFTEEISNIKYELEGNDSLSDSTVNSQVQCKSYQPEQSFLSFNQRENEDNTENGENSFKESKNSFITDDLTGRSPMNRQITESFVSIEEEYKYKDLEEGVVLMERRLCITPSCVMINKEELTSYYTCSTAESVSSLPQEMLLIDKKTLRERLTKLGENPGPITNSTHRVYLKRLMKLEMNQQNFKNEPFHNENSSETFESHSVRSSLISLNWRIDLQLYKDRERETFQEFARPDPTRKWREGLTKTCFNYLLLDSRITRDLPNRKANLSLQEQWETFLSAIFYVGKGKQTRPYAHLYDAFHIWVSSKVETTNKKIKKILDIWNEKQGVVVLHIFHNTIPVEAYTREAAMIDALSIDKLANCKGGEYYGKIATWNNKEKCDLGKYLLYKAMKILMMEGERHLYPEHL